MSYTIIIPIYNEEKSIPRLLGELETYSKLNQIIIIDDGSTDSSSLLLSKCKFITLITLKENRGKGYSVMEVVKAFSKFLNKEIKHKIGPRREGDSQMIVANVDKFDEFFSWKPKFNNLEQIIKTAFEWEKKLNNTK